MHDGLMHICYSPLGRLDKSNPDAMANLSSNFLNTLVKYLNQFDISCVANTTSRECMFYSNRQRHFPIYSILAQPFFQEMYPLLYFLFNYLTTKHYYATFQFPIQRQGPPERGWTHFQIINASGCLTLLLWDNNSGFMFFVISSNLAKTKAYQVK